MKIFSINLNDKNIAKLLYEINIKKSIIKIVETTSYIITLLNIKNNKNSFIEIYHNEKFNKLKNKFFEKSIPNDIIYIKNDKFGLEEGIEELVISFAKEEKIIIYNIKKEFKKSIISNIKCSKKQDSMKIYNDILIIGGQNNFYLLDFYTKKIILICNENDINISSLNIINNLLLIVNKNRKIIFYKIIKNKKIEKIQKIEKITQKILEKKIFINYLICNEEYKILYIYYHSFLEIIQVNDI